MKIITLNKDDFDIYAKNHNCQNIYQTSSYGQLMSKNGFSPAYIGFVNNNNQLIGASLILSKKIVFNYKYAYAPNGFLMDYNNYDFVNEVTTKLRKLLFKQKYIFFRIDPLILCSKRNIKGEIVAYNPEIDTILEILRKENYKHKGFNNYFENTKARWNAILDLNTNNERLYRNLNKQTRNKINKANKLGIVIYKASADQLPIMYDFIKKKHYRNLKYYQDLLDSYNNDAEIYLAKIEPEKYVRDSKNEYEKKLAINEELTEKITKNNSRKNLDKTINKKMESDKALGNAQANLIKATKLFQSKPEGLIIGGAIIIKQSKSINLLIEGFDKKYNNFNPNYLLKWELIKKFNNEGYHEFNLNAITGEFKKKNKYSGLNEMKLGFNANAVEYIGEFDYIINSITYKLFKNKVKKNTKN